MIPTWWLLLVALLLLVGLFLSQTAGRLDRLHIRVDRARTALDGQLLRRAGVASELATSGLLDPATSLLLADTAHLARELPDDTDPAARLEAEDAVTLALHAALPDADAVALVAAGPGGADLVEDIDAATRRVEYARVFLDDAVQQCAAMRTRPIVRAFRLAGRAPWPSTFPVDATRPDGLVGAAG